jgi:predicted RNA methylase
MEKKKKARREIDLEQYFTQPTLADRLLKKTIDVLNLDIKKDIFIEPSAGDGSFSDKIIELGIENHKFYDIEPMKEGIIKQDFFLLSEEFKDSVFIGNPPFGYKGKLAVQFINHSFKLGAKYVAFILPITFSRYSAQRNINKNAALIYEEELMEESIYKNIKKKKDYDIKTIFQIWELNSTKENKRAVKLRTKHPDFSVHMYNLDKERKSIKWFNEPWDFCIYRQGYYDYSLRFFPKDFKNLDLEKYQYMIFKANNKKVLKRLLKMDYTKLSKKNLIRPGISVTDIVEEYYRLYNNVKSKKRDL